jgi:hypothetical protein
VIIVLFIFPVGIMKFYLHYLASVRISEVWIWWNFIFIVASVRISEVGISIDATMKIKFHEIPTFDVLN